ncbi:MAG: SCO family protein [Betaproteobacteria bacterium]|nr:SCO family protein [Betaproteobacteria bacterium]
MRVAAVGLIGLSACSQKPAKFNAMDVTDAPWGQSYSLPDLQGNIITPASFTGKVTAVFFGFMYCPDACPTHLTKMGEVKKLLGKHAEKFQIVFITIDPERDAADQLKKYLASFDPTIVGLRGSLDQTQAIAKDFRVFYKKVDTKDSRRDPKAYTIDHTTFTYVYDGQGKLRLVIPHDLAVEKIASDIRNLITR